TLARELHARSDGARAALLVRALAAVPGPDATHALALEAARREGPDDLVRLLLGSLSRRPPEELAPIATAVALAGRHARGGPGAFGPGRALAIARGRPPEPRPWVPDDRLLPEKFAASGVAFLVDAETAMDAPFEAAAPASDPGSHERDAKNGDAKNGDAKN